MTRHRLSILPSRGLSGIQLRVCPHPHRFPWPIRQPCVRAFRSFYTYTYPLHAGRGRCWDAQDPKLWYGIGILYDRYGSLDHAEEAFTSTLDMDRREFSLPLLVPLFFGSYFSVFRFAWCACARRYFSSCGTGIALERGSRGLQPVPRIYGAAYFRLRPGGN
jgi:hypothetical protein